MIITFSQGSLTNETHFQHKTEIRDILQRYPAITSGLGVLFKEYIRWYDEEDTTLEGIAKSDITKLIHEKDRVRDETTAGLFRHIDADCYHFNPELRVEAIGLQNIKNHYAGITQRSLDAQTASTYNMLQELNDRRDVLEHLHLDEWIDRLDADNKAVNDLIKDRDSEKVARPVSKMKEIRPQIDRVTNEIYSALETFERLNFNADVPECIKAVNVVNKRYADNLAQAAGHKASAKNKKEADNTAG